jgi:hypothetical protein
MALINVPMMQCDYDRCKKLFEAEAIGWVRLEHHRNDSIVLKTSKSNESSLEHGEHYCSLECYVKHLKSQQRTLLSARGSR